MQQTTIDHSVQCSGIGLHSGHKVHLVLKPAPEDSGIQVAVSGNGQTRYHRVRPEKASGTTLATTLSLDGASLATVEHLFAAIRGLDVDNLRIEIRGGEAPIMDGSAAPFVFLLRSAGIKKQHAPRRVYRLVKSLEITDGDRFIKARPYPGFRVDYTIDFAHPLIGEQRMSFDLTAEGFANAIAKARTFGFLKDVEALQQNGVALGGSLDNAVVLDDYALVNPEGLRFHNEFVRHKILDFIGDMALMELPLYGRFEVRLGGHALHNQFLRVLSEQRAKYLEEVELAPQAPARDMATSLPGEATGVPAPA